MITSGAPHDAIGPLVPFHTCVLLCRSDASFVSHSQRHLSLSLHSFSPQHTRHPPTPRCRVSLGLGQGGSTSKYTCASDETWVEAYLSLAFAAQGMEYPGSDAVEEMPTSSFLDNTATRDAGLMGVRVSFTLTLPLLMLRQYRGHFRCCCLRLCCPKPEPKLIRGATTTAAERCHRHHPPLSFAIPRLSLPLPLPLPLPPLPSVCRSYTYIQPSHYHRWPNSC